MNVLTLEKIELLFDHRGICGLRGVDLSIQKGEIVALMGPSGSGKTTLLHVVDRKLSPTNGQLSLNGNTAIITRKSHLNHQVSVLNNLLHINNDMELARYWLDELNISGKINTMPERLSGGEYQRALLAQQLMLKPTLLLIDEAMEQLDPLLRSELLELLKQLVVKNTLSILWVTHLWPEASLFADRIAVIQFGKILQCDSPSQLYFHPSTPFVAEFSGITNFQTWHRKSRPEHTTLFSTPFGDVNLPMPWDREDALAMARPNFFRPDEKGPILGKVIKSEFCQNRYLTELSIGQQHSVLIFNDARIKNGDQLRLSLDLTGIVLF